MKLPLYFATLQVTETQLPLLLTWFHPPEFRQLRCLSELPCLLSLLYPRGEPTGARDQPCLPSLTYLSLSALPGRPSGMGS
ncbi:similar to RIKEN cDNA 2210012G02, isoform CRA_a [Rattus norvegicus]|uniref:Similar to RIKEN cDNA 2210012G02, isoform CRA_a n=1 Tax=Rattus norvegicus TaxID=10116 RepID=A6JYQ6_RAT|nr:similar to RIKEN cDNA 2210012G02, isoform CRA_a [Rattus norvegicus]